MIRHLALLAALALAGCAQTSTAVTPAATMPVAPETEEGCKAAGGSWGRVGMMGTLACTMPAPDAGKACSDSDECAGQCWSDAAPGTTAKGMCQPTNMPFGCHSEVKGGVVQPALCAD